MANNKKAISAYLSVDIEEYLTQYCTEYDITRKDKSGELKPALGTAVVEILRIFFSGNDVPSPLPDNVPLLPSNLVTEDKLNEILSNLENFSTVPSAIPSNVATQDDINKVLSNVPSIVNKQLEDKLAAHTKPLITEIEQLKEQLSFLAGKPSVPGSNEQNIESTGKLLSSTEEAYELACSRGFSGKKNSFRSGINRSNTAEDYRQKYGIVKVGDRQSAKYYDIQEAD